MGVVRTGWINRELSFICGAACDLRLIEPVCCVPQKDQPQDGHEVFVRRQIGIRPQIIGDLPEARFEFLNSLQVVGGHSVAVPNFTFSARLTVAPHKNTRPTAANLVRFVIVVHLSSDVPGANRVRSSAADESPCCRRPHRSRAGKNLIGHPLFRKGPP
jgi:hypothetical protein